MAAAQRHSQRVAVERHRELARQVRAREAELVEQERIARAQYNRTKREEQEAAKIAERQRAVDEVALFESYLEVLTSIHRDLVLDTDWVAIASSKPPEAPAPSTENERKARATLRSHAPGILARLSGAARRTREELERAVEDGKAQDELAHRQALAEHQHLLAKHGAEVALAHLVLGQNTGGYQQALGALTQLDDLVELGIEAGADALEADAVALSCIVRGDEIVPDCEVKLSAGGKMTSKKLAESKYWGLYQDFVCGCALRLAREAFGLLPVSRVVVNVSCRMLNSSTGHVDLSTILAVHFTRTAVAAINPDAVDASDSLLNFNSRMKFKKTSGFDVVEAIQLADSWVQ